MMQVLISAGTDVNSRNESKETFLMMLGEEGTSDMVWDLIHAGAKRILRNWYDCGR
jgi:predicted secreted protein